MGLFSSSKGTNTSALDWNDLTEIRQLDALIGESADRPVAIFKHSTRCGISRMALKTFESEMPSASGIGLYFLDLLEHRNISNEIARRFEVMHESPQIILIKNGKAVYHDSHSGISAERLQSAVG